MKVLRHTVVTFQLLLLVAGCGVIDDDSSSGKKKTSQIEPLSQRYDIDGVVDFDQFENVESATLEFIDDLGDGVATGKTTDLRWAIENDDRDIYFAAEWTDKTFDNNFDSTLGPLNVDAIRLQFDNDGNGRVDEDEDGRTVLVAQTGSQYVDQHASSGNETDTIGDGIASMRYDSDAQLYQAEFRFSMSADVNGEDADLSTSTRYNIVLFDALQSLVPDGSVVGVYGNELLHAVTTDWADLPLESVSNLDHPEIPDNLTGLIVFVSSHDEAFGEIYTFDPLTQIVTRVTNMPSLYKDNVSLSNDRTTIAFHGSSSPADTTSLEIYRVDVDGSNFTQLTDNDITDGHPGWSLDDQKIIYASFRDGGNASIVIMDTDGTELDDLTPDGTDDNDPDYLPDGRIVFKTNRFSTLPEVRLAVMDEDGTNVEQLSFIDGVSDHDPMGNATHVVFERFTKDTSFSTDPEAFFSPWNIVEIDIASAAETALLADGFVNFLPVYDPTGQYICYLKIRGYTDARLISRDGTDLGRLIPDITSIFYIDWK